MSEPIVAATVAIGTFSVAACTYVIVDYACEDKFDDDGGPATDTSSDLDAGPGSVNEKR